MSDTPISRPIPTPTASPWANYGSYATYANSPWSRWKDYQVDADKVNDFVETLPKVVNRVVSQSIAAGTVVTEGTTVDLTFAPSRTVPGSIFTDGHKDLKPRLLGEVYDSYIAESDDVKSLLEKRSDVEELTDDDIVFLTTFAEEQDLIVTGEPGKTANDLFVTLQLANNFIG